MQAFFLCSIVILLNGCTASVTAQPPNEQNSLNKTSGKTRRSKLPEERLKADLMLDYDYRARPILNGSDAVDINVRLVARTILAVNERDQIITVMSFVDLIWTDMRLSWNPKDYAGIDHTVFFTEKIWTPDVCVQNTITEAFNAIHYKYFRSEVTSNGRVQWITEGIFQLKCKMDITYFPFDDHVCNIALGSWAYTGDMVTISLRNTSMRRQDTQPNAQWELVDAKAIVREEYYPCCTQPYYYVYGILYLSRKPLFYLMNILMPCILLSMLLNVVYLLPHESGERISLGVTILLAFSVFQVIITDSIPKTSDNLPLIGNYITCVTVLAGLSIVLSIISLQVFHRNPAHPPPKICTGKTSLRRYFRRNRRSQEVVESMSPNANGTTEETDGHATENSGKNYANGKQHRYVDLIMDHHEEKDTHCSKPDGNPWHVLARRFDVVCFIISMMITAALSGYFLVIFPAGKPNVYDIPVQFNDY